MGAFNRIYVIRLSEQARTTSESGICHLAPGETGGRHFHPLPRKVHLATKQWNAGARLFILLAAARNGPDTRRLVLDAIIANPGITKNQLRQNLYVNWRTVDHHVKRLSRDGTVVQVKGMKSGWCHHLFETSVPPADRIWFIHLVREAGAEVIADLATGTMGTYDLRDRSGKERQSIWKTITRLVADGIVVKHGKARPRYELARAPPGVQAYLAHLHEPSLHGAPVGDEAGPGLERRRRTPDEQRGLI